MKFTKRIDHKYSIQTNKALKPNERISLNIFFKLTTFAFVLVINGPHSEVKGKPLMLF